MKKTAYFVEELRPHPFQRQSLPRLGNLPFLKIPDPPTFTAKFSSDIKFYSIIGCEFVKGC